MRPASGLLTLSLLGLAGCAPHPSKVAAAAGPEPSRITAGDALGCGPLIQAARRNRVQGTVKLQVRVTGNGEIRDVQVLAGDALLIPAALTAVRHWRLAPCLIDSQAVETVRVLSIPFNLSQ